MIQPGAICTFIKPSNRVRVIGPAAPYLGLAAWMVEPVRGRGAPQLALERALTRIDA